MKKRPTVTDVAKLANVGASTVSRHLRGVSVSPDAAIRISEAIAQLGYHPDETARALRVGRTRTIGVIIPQVSNMFYSRAVQLIEEEASKRGCAVILLTHQESLKQQGIQLATIRRYRADGVILAPAAGSTLEDISAALPGTPVVAIDRFISSEMDSVVLRNRDAARVATEHLLRHGYKRIACVVSRPEIASFKQRWEGYVETMGLNHLETLLIQAPNHEQLRYALTSTFVSHSRPDALLSFSNRVTQTILLAFDELALSREERLPLLGFDDFDLASLVDPPLSVIRQPTENMMRHATDLLFRRIEGSEPVEPKVIALPGQPIYRKSCGCS
ncbi:MAG: LacI family DNA-binding transcriptional regulator [Acidobacteria bacterium]|nr:LacI family DNA-binding transcriptional regulator [Acidobacteriota bacterium]